MAQKTEPIIAPSILSADFANLGRDVAQTEQAGAQYLHIDIMDGHFVENLTFGANVVAALRNHSHQVFDCHMMVDNPESYLADLKQAGANIIGVHVEATPHIHRVLSKIKALGLKAEVVINPGTPVSMIEPVLPLVDQVLVMTVDPGFGGQAFQAANLTKVRQLAALRTENDWHYAIEVDGGVNEKTVAACAQAGANVFVAGSYVFGGDVAERIKKLKASANE